ncbi:MAG: CPBP family intramembrane metalloprotease, partial [Planctomycetaceae bacterium]|nr:CPBP family intramembrane metalloprotease [Planctomycetaceae bacterium]
IHFRNEPTSGAENSPRRGLPEIELFYPEKDTRSQSLVLAVQKRLQLLVREEAIVTNRNGQPVRRPVASRLMLTPVPLPAGDAPKFSLATFVPLMLILMTVTGAVYPAIDLTAGERERGTLEVLVAAPVPRMQLLGAKFVAVLTVAMLTAIVNLIAMLVTLYASGLESLIFGERGLSLIVMGQILALLILFAGFFSAVLLALTSFARSFKEAQAYLIPLMLVALAPGIFSLTPGLKMNGLLAVVPLVNIVLLGRDLLEGQMVPLLFAGVVISTVLYAVLALSVAARVFGSDAILYGSQGNLKDLLRRPQHTRDVPTLTQVTFALAVLFPGFVILGSLPGRFADLPMLNRLALSSLITIVLFAIWPLVMVWRNSVRWMTAFRMGIHSPWFFIVAVLWGLSLWIWAYELEVLTLSPSRHDALRELFEAIKRDIDQIPLAWRLVTLALIPAVCEEWFFRGYLLSGLKARRSNLQAVLISAVLFGLFHVVVRDVLFFERFLP